MKPSAFDIIDSSVHSRRTSAPECGSFMEFLTDHARVAGHDGTAEPFSMVGRAPLKLIAEWIDKILRNTLDLQSVEMDGVTFGPGKLKGCTLAVGGGAQWGKTIMELNLMAYLTAIRFISVGNYLPDGPKVEEIVGQKFRPNVLDVYPWMAEMIQLGKVENASGKTIDRKESYTVTDGRRKSFGNFCGMHKPPTSITIGVAMLDEVDDIPARNIGYVDARMTNSVIHLTIFIGTQRVSGAGQNARVAASSYHVRIYTCPGCRKEWNLEENFPRIIRKTMPHMGPRRSDPMITAEMGHDRDAEYYCACPECGEELHRDDGRFVAKHPERVKEASLGVRVSQFTISAISLQEIVGAWYAAMKNPSGEAMRAFYCDRVGIPNAGSAQPITQKVLDGCRALGLADKTEAAETYAMSLTPGPASRFAGMDTGPRCWFWCEEQRTPAVSGMVWAEMLSSGNAPMRIPILMAALGIECLFIDAGGEPDLTKRLALSLNGLEDYQPPVMPKNELLKSRLTFTTTTAGKHLIWDGTRGRWSGLRCAAVLFVAGEAKGIEQTIGFTQEGRIYPLIKCSRAESIQLAVNDFLTPADGVLEMLDGRLRSLPRARLPQTYIGPGVSQALLDGHLLNLRKERDVRTGAEDWIDGVENHLGLARTYARLCSVVGAGNAPAFGVIAPGLAATLKADNYSAPDGHRRPVHASRRLA